MKKCKGCGAILQNEDKNAVGYTPKLEADYCQRCFRLIHYDDLTVSMKTGIDPDKVLEQIASMDGLVLWVVDLFDFEASMIPGLSRKLAGKDIVMVATKRDLLPKTVSAGKIAKFVFGRLKEMGVQVKELVVTSMNDKDALEDIQGVVEKYAKGRPVAVMGRANAGKSTLLNHLMGEKVLTSSRYPGTTLELNSVTLNGVEYVDTPGIEIENSLLMAVNEQDLKTIIPTKTIKPEIYQLKGDQSFAIGGLARLDLSGCDHASAVFYTAEGLKKHRSKLENADELWQNHYGELLKPVPLENKFTAYSIGKDEEKIDVVIQGLGWVCLSGDIRAIRVQVPWNTSVVFRKAML